MGSEMCIRDRPSDIDLVVGIPRSGMLAASLLSLHLNCDLSDLDAFVAGVRGQGGLRARRPERGHARHALVLDDCIGTGRAMREARERLAAASVADDVKISFAAIYTAEESSESVDFSWNTVPLPRVFEWNVLHHGQLGTACMDIDGVLCADPQEHENDDGPAYEAFLATARPRLVPKSEIGWLVTSRLERYRPQTERWLAEQGVKYGRLLMHPATSGQDRRQAQDHAIRKARAYVETGAWLFIESDPGQAAEIARVTGRSVYCTETRSMFQADASDAALARVRRLPTGIRSRLRRLAK